MKLTGIRGFSIATGGLALVAAGFAGLSPVLAAPPMGAWEGSYLYEQPLGPMAGGVQAFVNHRLTLGPDGCRLVAQGYQTDETIRCKAVPNGDKLDVVFTSYGDGKIDNKYGVKVYKVDQPLFSLAQTPKGLTTTWGGYAKSLESAKPGVYFKKEAR